MIFFKIKSDEIEAFFQRSEYSHVQTVWVQQSVCEEIYIRQFGVNKENLETFQCSDVLMGRWLSFITQLMFLTYFFMCSKQKAKLKSKWFL